MYLGRTLLWHIVCCCVVPREDRFKGLWKAFFYRASEEIFVHWFHMSCPRNRFLPTRKLLTVQYIFDDPLPAHFLAQILRRVRDRLDRILDIDRRHQKAIALLLLERRGEAGPGRDRSEPAETRTGNTAVPSGTFGPDLQSLLTGGRTRGASPGCGFGGGPNTDSKATGRRGRRRRSPSEDGTLFRRKGKGTNQGDHRRGLTRMSSIQCRAGDDVDVGRAIACVRKGRGDIFSGSGNCAGVLGGGSPSSSPRLLVADEARGVMYGFGARLGRASELEDRWL